MKLVNFHMQTTYQELGTFIALACEKCKTFVKPWSISLNLAQTFAEGEKLLKEKMNTIFNNFNKLQKTITLLQLLSMGESERSRANLRKKLRERGMVFA